MTKVKQLFSKYCQNNPLFKVFSHIMTRKMRASFYFVTGLKTGFLNCPLVFNFSFLSLFILRKYIAFP